MILKLFLALNILTAFQPNISQDTPSQPSNPKLAINTETVLYWLIPTGTQTWTERKLIGYDIKENPNDNNFSLTWKIDKPYLHDHLHIQAIGEGVLIGIINLSMN
ncbi:hypothetical protein [Cytobacillus praedii]|uniref:hypothetical protein n=1 Tax=Cytobacillus praedii TaxID=1742358 RepID=UPI002E204A0A|nr:hypothetical protein [Cytobacillus praedii]